MKESERKREKITMKNKQINALERIFKRRKKWKRILKTGLFELALKVKRIDDKGKGKKI